MKVPRHVTVALLASYAALSGCRSPDAIREPVPAPILMVCVHGSVKSLMAASLFNRAATERRLPFRAIARGVSPDRFVPPAIEAALARDGYDVKRFVPSKVSQAELRSASRIIAISLEAAALKLDSDTSVDSWLDVPAASVDYAAAMASLQRHVDALLDELERSRARPLDGEPDRDLE
jgi:arsenate reductase